MNEFDKLRTEFFRMILVLKVLEIYDRWETDPSEMERSFEQSKRLLDHETIPVDEALYGNDDALRSDLIRTLAHSIAVLSLAEGGVEAFGRNWSYETYKRSKTDWLAGR